MYKYIYPITRTSDVETTVESEIPLTTEKQVMAFYQREINAGDLTNILSAYNSPGFFDDFDYIRDNIINRSPIRGACRYCEIMGDLRFYERLTEIEYRVYYVCLGS
jgi:hypothetical protein